MALDSFVFSSWDITNLFVSQRLLVTIRVKNDSYALVLCTSSLTGSIISAGNFLALICRIALFKTSMAVSFVGIEECPPGISTERSIFIYPFSPVATTATGRWILLKCCKSICPPSSNTNAGCMPCCLNQALITLAPRLPDTSSSWPSEI